MEQLVKGFLKFRTEVFGKSKAHFTRLSTIRLLCSMMPFPA